LAIYPLLILVERLTDELTVAIIKPSVLIEIAGLIDILDGKICILP